jgi:4a-hydroxytetrahydrobiopterin dehydratase
MSTATAEELRTKKCKPCEGGVPAVLRAEAERLLEEIPEWQLSEDGKRIRREWVAKDFLAAIDFFIRVSQVAEAEGHHPDLHLVGYRNVSIELRTHAIDGLSENDFITAAKIDDVPIETKEK